MRNETKNVVLEEHGGTPSSLPSGPEKAKENKIFASRHGGAQAGFGSADKKQRSASTGSDTIRISCAKNYLNFMEAIVRHSYKNKELLTCNWNWNQILLAFFVEK
ncbi:8371_t:CDS:1 [Funneliformis mosseae]|uniref:8371_t:CDS:1 n=1 Tax=Funneliformis mosseae TaxID=27381 RepID=A0A9N9DZU2_FUNMO|nr:8371_t:CDS:1 [Funneliformis mosseae]